MLFVNTQQAIRDIKSAFSSQLSKKQIDKAIMRAINHTISKSKTTASKEVTKLYKIKASVVKKDISLIRASIVKQQGKVHAKGKLLPLIHFGARQNQQGVSVNVSGTRKTIRSAFIKTMASGHTGVFARGQYAKEEFKFRKKRLKKRGPDLPINELKSVAVPQVIMRETILAVVSKQMQTDFPSRLVHELGRLTQSSTQP